MYTSSLPSQDHNDFTPVTRKRRAKKSNKSTLLAVETNDTTRRMKLLERARQRINDYCDELKQSAVYDHIKSLLDIEMNDITPQYLLVYGLGSMMESREACRQLALCCLLEQHLKLTDKVQGYDPVWSTEDRQLFEESGFQCIEKNEGGYRSLDACTLVYMPHCPKGLYANLLAANWHPDRLKHLILLGNCLETYVERLTEAQLRKEFPHALEACKLLNMRYIRLKRTSKEGGHSTSVIEEDRRQFDDNQRAFSELCLQRVDSSLLSKQQHSIEWSSTTTTTIMDPELIINE